ncbi:MAG: GTP 3',8-cyclase MoaA [Gammaproteobacteria bacterium]
MSLSVPVPPIHKVLKVPIAPIDTLGRRFVSLRLSMTARCNFACQYCVPDKTRLVAAKDELQAEEYAYLLELLMHFGIRKLRITGGEPLLSSQLIPFLQKIAHLPLTDKALTSNGTLLESRLPALIAAGVKRLNISLDSLDPETFKRISRGGKIEQTLSGIESGIESGLKIRINMVVTKGMNDHEILPMLEFCAARNLELRFIELMQMGHLKGSALWGRQLFTQPQILSLIGNRYPIVEASAERSATAKRWYIPALDSHFGIIANTSAPFCAQCDRLRVTSNGFLYGCISSDRGVALRPLLGMGKSQALEQLQQMLEHALTAKSQHSFAGSKMRMKFLGG